MRVGDRVTLKKDVNLLHMFPPKGEEPATRNIKSGSVATIKEVYESGAGILQFEDGLKMLSMSVSKQFKIWESEEG